MPDQTRLLVVDDDADIRELLSAYLARYDMAVETAADGAGLFEKLDHAHFDLIILDIMLPGEDGLSLCRRLRGASSIPVIFLTALDSSTDRVVGLELGADDYVVKPFDPRELLAARSSAALPTRGRQRRSPIYAVSPDGPSTSAPASSRKVTSGLPSATRCTGCCSCSLTSRSPY